MKKALEIGGGLKPHKLNKYETYYVDFIDRDLNNFLRHNLNIYPYPFENNFFDLIIAYNVIEHLIPANEKEELWIKHFEELYRISKNEAMIKIIVPHYTNGFLVEHRMHFSVEGFRELFEYKNWFRENAQFNYELIDLRIEMNKLWKWLEPILNQSRVTMSIWERYFCYIIRPKEIRLTLKVKKGESLYKFENKRINGRKYGE